MSHIDILLAVKVPLTFWNRADLLLFLVVIPTSPWNIITINVDVAALFFWRMVNSALRLRLAARLDLVETNLGLSSKGVSSDAAVSSVVCHVVIILVVLWAYHWNMLSATSIALARMLLGLVVIVVALSQRCQINLTNACTCTTFLATHHDHRVQVIRVVNGISFSWVTILSI